MSDFPYVAPPADGLERAFADARRRRLRTAGLSTSTFGVTLALLVTALGGSGTQSLVQQPAPEQPAVSRLLPDVSSRSLPTPNTDPVRGVVAGAGTGTMRSPVVFDVVGAPSRGPLSPLLSGPAAQQDRSQGRDYVAPRITRHDYSSYYAASTPGCSITGGQGQPANDLCTSAYANSTAYGTLRAPVTLSAEVCSSRTQLTVLDFAGRNEVDVEVVRGKRVVWRWSDSHPDDAAGHHISVDAQTCTTWSVEWSLVDGQGQPVPSGDYSLRTTFLADQLHRVSTTPFTAS